MKNKKNKRFWELPAIIVLGVFFTIGIYQYEKYRLEKAPKLDFEHKVGNFLINKIEYKRNALYSKKTGVIFNDTLYDTYICSISSVYQNGNDEVLNFSDILPPFIITKEENNDTIHLVKGNVRYYLLISDELKRRKIL